MGCPFYDLEYRLSTAFELPLEYPRVPLAYARANVPRAARCAVGAVRPHQRRSIAASGTLSTLEYPVGAPYLRPSLLLPVAPSGPCSPTSAWGTRSVLAANTAGPGKPARAAEWTARK